MKWNGPQGIFHRGQSTGVSFSLNVVLKKRVSESEFLQLICVFFLSFSCSNDLNRTKMQVCQLTKVTDKEITCGPID